jgi:hypothetical protein
MTFSLRVVALALAAEAVGYAGCAVVVADVLTHKKVEISRGVNTRGFRGALRVHKIVSERRIALVGGTAAYGYGVDWDSSLGPVLERRLKQAWRTKYRPGYEPVVVNLSELGAGAASYVTTLRRYEDLAADVVCIYDGYAPPAGRIRHGRDESPIFRRIRYLPILADVVGGSAPWSAPTAGVDPFLEENGGADPSCERGSAEYCAAMTTTVGFALEKNAPVVVVTPPYVSARHQRQQESLAAALRSRYGRDSRFSYIAVGSSTDLHNPAMSADGVNPNAAGYEAIGDRIVDVMFDAIHQR